MKCYFRPRYYSEKDKKIIKECATAGALAQIQQACDRSDAMTFIAALNVGLSPKTINRLISEKKRVFGESVEYREEGVLDFGLQKHLDDNGIKFRIGCDEI